ncbi:1-acyl-sn-glycerol-3-phosphate acyltransferase beta-like [Penaeus monodon]|uniref:1-acyl-sn-glycerol-3-phosphate acyltransferase beta-like n=1 Tax=Penaeus monodon TaxID=6687 RepID=UPI0018A75538|nr:1-acyl-sn-glycerol-3-phosphate acyltransferase beta-like [Penaeus monodon]
MEVAMDEVAERGCSFLVAGRVDDSGLVPLRTASGGRLATVPVGWMARAFLWAFNVRLECPNRDKIQAHEGMIICNHLSYADVAAVLAVTPVRFLSTAGVRRIPIIGWLAIAIETIFVNRNKQESRKKARHEIAQKLNKQISPPVLIFPEGGTGPGTWLLPFRHGAFAIAMESGVSILPCALVYEPLSAFHYFQRNDTLLKAVWRLAMQPSVKRIILEPLTPLDSVDYDDPERFAHEAEQILAGSLGLEIGIDRERFV